MSVNQATIRKVLLSAAEYIERNGWTQGSTFAHGGHNVLGHGSKRPPACAYGAIVSGVSFLDREELGHNTSFEVSNAASDYVESCLGIAGTWGPKYRGLPRWNDARERTANQVVEALRGAAASIVEAP
jgi:hypothetical protein